MKFIMGIILFIILNSSLQAYSKKIILSTFSTQEKAQKRLKSFEKSGRKYSELIKLAKKNSFKIYVRESGKYHIIVVEPILNKNVLNKAIKIAKLNFKHAYANSYTPPTIEDKHKSKDVQKKSMPIAIEKEAIELNTSKEISTTLKEEVALQHPVVQDVGMDVNKTEQEPMIRLSEEKNTTIVESKEILELVEEVVKESKELDIGMILKWILFLVIISTASYYFIKFKRIYDEY